MRETILGNHLQKIPSIAVGCMRLSALGSSYTQKKTYS